MREGKTQPSDASPFSDRRSSALGCKNPDPAVSTIPRPAAKWQPPGPFSSACHGGIHFPADGIFILYLAPVMTAVSHAARGASPAGWQDIERRPVRGLMDDGLRFGEPSHGRDRRVRHDMRKRRDSGEPLRVRCPARNRLRPHPSGSGRRRSWQHR